VPGTTTTTKPSTTSTTTVPGTTSTTTKPSTTSTVLPVGTTQPPQSVTIPTVPAIPSATVKGLKIKKDINTIGIPGSQLYSDFETKFKNNIATALNIPAYRIAILSVKPGPTSGGAIGGAVTPSSVVDFIIFPGSDTDPTPSTLATTFITQASNQSSALLSGDVTRDIDTGVAPASSVNTIATPQVLSSNENLLEALNQVYTEATDVLAIRFNDMIANGELIQDPATQSMYKSRKDMYDLFTRLVTAQEANPTLPMSTYQKPLNKVMIDFYKAQTGTDIYISMLSATAKINGLKAQVTANPALINTLRNEIVTALNEFYKAETAMTTIMGLAVISRAPPQQGGRKRKHVTHRKRPSKVKSSTPNKKGRRRIKTEGDRRK
jgi:hypothetical protein